MRSLRKGAFLRLGLSRAPAPEWAPELRIAWWSRFGILCLQLSLIWAATALHAAGPQPDSAKWDNLKTLTPGEGIQIVLKDVKSYKGQFQAVSDQAVVVRLETGDQTFSRQDVARVSTKGESHRLRNALLGAGVGAGAGLGVGAGVDASQKCTGLGPCFFPNAGKEILTPVGGIVGAVIGVAVPTGRWHDVYRAQ